jgi:hypothetical protein
LLPGIADANIMDLGRISKLLPCFMGIAPMKKKTRNITMKWMTGHNAFSHGCQVPDLVI